MSRLFKKMTQAILDGEAEEIKELVEEALADEIPAIEILNEGLVPGMDQVAEKFREGDMFIPEVLLSAEAMQGGNDLLKPYLVKSGTKRKGTVVIGTVAGDLHDIGKKIVGMMLEGTGFEVFDIGMDVSAEHFIDCVKEHNADIVGMSAMLTTTMPVMAKVSEVLTVAGLAETVQIMVGGAPLTDEYAKKIKGNYSYDAASAVDLANGLLSHKTI